MEFSVDAGDSCIYEHKKWILDTRRDPWKNPTPLISSYLATRRHNKGIQVRKNPSLDVVRLFLNYVALSVIEVE
jgi:hypothetical protein